MCRCHPVVLPVILPHMYSASHAAMQTGQACRSHSCSPNNPKPAAHMHRFMHSANLQWAQQMRGHSRSIACRGYRQTQDKLKHSRTTQVATTQLLTDLLQSENTRATAQKHVAAIDEEFFMVASTYMDMAKKEGNLDVSSKLETVLKIAMEEKQKTLRPEIQLLNNLMAATDDAQQTQVLNKEEAKQALTMNNGYFFGLLDRMIDDVNRQPTNARSATLKQQLQQIRQSTTALRESLEKGMRNDN